MDSGSNRRGHPSAPRFLLLAEVGAITDVVWVIGAAIDWPVLVHAVKPVVAYRSAGVLSVTADVGVRRICP